MAGNIRRRSQTGALALAGLLGALALGRPALAASARCWIDKGALVVPAAFGDIAGDFLIDPATPNSQLHVTRAQSAGLEAGAVSRDLMIAGQRVAGFTLAVADLDARTGAFDTSINGVLGADLLRLFTVDIDPSPCRLRLSRARLRRVAGAVRLAVSDLDGRPVVTAVISDGVSARPGLFAIDTADWASRIAGAGLSRALVVAPGLPPPVRLRALEVAGRLFQQVPAMVGPADDAGISGAIGMAVWSHWRLRLDIRDGWLDLTPTRKAGWPWPTIGCSP